MQSLASLASSLSAGGKIVFQLLVSPSAHKVPDDQMQQAIAQSIISKGSLWRQALEVLVGWVHLHPQAHCIQIL